MLDSPLFKELAEKDPIKLGISVVIVFFAILLARPNAFVKEIPHT